MPISNEQRAYWSQKNPAAEFDTITFSHPAFSQIRLVANAYSNQVFAGEEYLACAMEVSKPEQGKDPISAISLQFARPVVGDEFKRVISLMTPVDWMTPISLRLRQFSELDRDNPMQDWTLFVAEDGISMSRETVQVKATDDNPMILNVSTLYDIERYPGLEFI